MAKTIMIRPVTGYVEEEINKDSLNDSIFSKQYKAAFAAIEKFVEERGNLSDDKPIDNIFGFIGDRGSGKTSCMQSVKKRLCSHKNKDFPYQNIAKTTFLELGMIDPSFLDQENNIIGLFIAQLYNSFVKEDEKECNDDFICRKELLKAFEEAQANYKYLFGETEKLYDELEDINQLAAAVNLRVSLSKLVKAFSKHREARFNTDNLH